MKRVIQDVSPAHTIISYNHMVNNPTLNNVLASKHERRQHCPVSDQTDTYNVLAHAKHK